MSHATSGDDGQGRDGRSSLAWWTGTPLYVRILVALALGALVGVVLHRNEAVFGIPSAKIIPVLAGPSSLVLKALGALAPPLILVAVLDTLVKAKLQGGVARRMVGLLILNTVVAILIGLLVANVVRPGRWAHLDISHPAGAKPQAANTPPADSDGDASVPAHADPVKELMKNVPESLLGPLVDNNVIGVIFVGVAFGIALRKLKPEDRHTAEEMVGVGLKAITIVLHWVVEVVPLGVFGIIAKVVGTQGFAPFKALAAFVLAVVIGLLLQGCYYLARIGLGTWVSPWRVVVGMRDAIVMAFSTDSPTATMPVTYACLRDNVGIRDESARMGALVGTNFNNDGTALYEAMSALFVSQLIGMRLGFGQQLMVVLTSIVASVGAAGIPEAGLVTMTLVFTAVGLPKEYIAVLLTVDWFLDRSRTVINMMGDVNVSCMLDGKTPATAAERVGEPAAAVATVREAVLAAEP